MLLGVATLATLLGLGCTDAFAPPRPAAQIPAVNLNLLESLGCLKFHIRANPQVVARADSIGCGTGALRLEMDTSPRFDASTQTFLMPIVLRNSTTETVIVPARLTFRADSSTVWSANGAPLPGPATITAVGDSGSVDGRVMVWRFDTLLAPSGQPQQLAPGSRTRRLWLAFQSPNWTQAYRIRLFAQAVRTTIPPRRLLVIADAGVISSLPAGETTYADRAVASYQFTVRPGYDSLRVKLDSTITTASGTVTMSGDHLLYATTIKQLTLIPGSQPLYDAFRNVFTASDPVSAYRQMLDLISAQAAVLPTDELTRRLDLVVALGFDWKRDSIALRRVNAALANRVFEIGAGSAASVRQRSGVEAFEMSSAYAVGDSAEPVMYAYMNGMLTTRALAEDAQERLESGFLQPSGPAYMHSRARSVLIYNRTGAEEIIPQTRGETATVCVAKYGHLAQVDGERFVRELEACIGTNLTRTFFDDLVEVATQLPTILLKLPFVEEDARALADTIRHWRVNEGRHVIVTAHSQGNFMTEQALRVLASSGAWTPNTDPLGIGVMSIAPPTQDAWTVDQFHHRTIIVRGDFVADTRWDPNNPPINSVDTPLSVAYADSLRIIGAAGPAAALVYLTQSFIWQRKLHAVVESYFDQPAPSQAIRAGIPALYREMTVGRVEALFSGEELYVGQGRNLYLYTKVYNRNGRPLVGRTLEWSTSDSTVASVSSIGRVTCVGAGSATIVVADWQARASYSYTCKPIPTMLTGTWSGPWHARYVFRSGTATFVLTQSGANVWGTVTFGGGLTSNVNGYVNPSASGGVQAFLYGHDAECAEFYRTQFGKINWPGCDFELVTGVGPGTPGQLNGWKHGVPGGAAANFDELDFNLVKQP